VTGIPYLQIAIAAVVPAVLYYLSLITMVHFQACKKGLQPLSRVDIPEWRSTLGKSYLLIPLVFLVYIISQGYTPFRAAFVTIILTVVVSAFKRSTRLGLKGILGALEKGAKESLMIAMATAAAGIVVGVVAMTGVGLMVTGLILSLAKGFLLIALLLTMLACMILGMGIPTVPAYIVVAAITIPTLLKLGVSVMAAHLFALYFAIIAVITPPVALAAYAGASIAGSNMFQTGLFAFRLGIIAYVVPYMFIFNPAILLIGPWQKILPVVLTAAMGTVSLAAGLEKWFVDKMRIYEVLVFVGGGFLLIVPEWRTDLVGGLCIAIGLLSQYLGRAKKVALGVADPSGSYDP
jgi:TRAP transporter 4TM/12TM fusion protein